MALNGLSKSKRHLGPHINLGFTPTAPTLLWATPIQIGLVETPGHWVMCVGGWGFRQPFSFGSLCRERKKQCRANFLILWSNRHDRICNDSGLCQRRHEQRLLSGHVTQFACLALIKRGNENKRAGVEVYQGFPKCPDSWIHRNYVFIHRKPRERLKVSLNFTLSVERYLI